MLLQGQAATDGFCHWPREKGKFNLNTRSILRKSKTSNELQVTHPTPSPVQAGDKGFWYGKHLNSINKTTPLFLTTWHNSAKVKFQTVVPLRSEAQFVTKGLFGLGCLLPLLFYGTWLQILLKALIQKKNTDMFSLFSIQPITDDEVQSDGQVVGRSGQRHQVINTDSENSTVLMRKWKI